jgi:hypothetical protein
MKVAPNRAGGLTGKQTIFVLNLALESPPWPVRPPAFEQPILRFDKVLLTRAQTIGFIKVMLVF